MTQELKRVQLGGLWYYDCDAVDAELTTLRATLAAYQEAQKNIMREQCGDEVHCTCVPLLRAEVERLTKELKEKQ